jgi:hypothetical protein
MYSSSNWPVFDAHASGFRECIDEISRYLISIEGFDAQHPLRLRLLSHLECFTERSLSPSSSSMNDNDHSWTALHQPSPSAFATPPLSSFLSPMTGYHHSQPQSNHTVNNATYHMHHYHQQRPPVDTSMSLPSASTTSACY